MSEKNKILWISFQQKHLLSYERFFSLEKNRFCHEIIIAKVRGFHYFLNILLSLFLYLKPYNSEKIELLIKEARKRGNVQSDFLLRTQAIFWNQWIENMLLRKHYDAIILWGGLQIYQVAVEVTAKEKKIPVFFMENGYLPNTTQFEKQGVNWRSSLKDLQKEEYMNISIDLERMSQIYLTNLVPREKRKSIFLTSENNEVEIPDCFCFLPFQVSKDSQIQLYSPWISNMPELVDVVFNAITRYNQRNKTNMKLVIKEHPSDFGRVSYDKMKSVWLDKGILLINSVRTQELIEKAEVIITINSSVGMEALLKKKPVILLGNAAYHQPGITQRASNVDEIVIALEALNDFDTVENQRDHFLYYLSEQRLVKGHWRNISINHWESIEEKIQMLLMSN